MVRAIRDVGGEAGYDPVTTWGYPERITPEVCAAARQWLRDNPATGAVDRSTLADWLIALGGATATKLTPLEVQARVATYAMMLGDRPAYWFTAATLRASGERFKWFPSVAEIVEFLRAECREQEQQVSLASRLADRAALAEIKRRAG